MCKETLDYVLDDAVSVTFTETGVIIGVFLSDFILITKKFPQFVVRENPAIANKIWNPLGWEAHWGDEKFTTMLTIYQEVD